VRKLYRSSMFPNLILYNHLHFTIFLNRILICFNFVLLNSGVRIIASNRDRYLSPPPTFTLPEYVAAIAQAYATASPPPYRRKRRYVRGVRAFVDDEAVQGEDDFNSSSEGSSGNRY
jgi:hypothetical protein